MGTAGGTDESRRWRLLAWGPTTLSDHGRAVSLRPRERAVLAALAALAPAAVSLDRLAELVWGQDQPTTAHKSLQNHVSRIRAEAGPVIETVGVAYQLSDGVDIVPPTVSEMAATEPYTDLTDNPEADSLRSVERHRRVADCFEQLRADAERAPLVALLDIEAFLVVHPDYPGAQEMYIHVLAASGQRRAALAAIRVARVGAGDGGVQLDRAMRDLERRLLDDDPTLRQAMPGLPGRSSASPMSSGHFIEFGQQLASLEASPDSSTTRLVAVTGPAGIGKTTLVEHVRDRSHSRGAFAVLVACSPEPSVPLEPIVDLLHQLADRFPVELTRGTDVDALRVLAPSLPLGSGAPTVGRLPDRDAIFDAVIAAVAAVPVPLIVIVEDLHWATGLTFQLLTACVRSAGNVAGSTFVTTSRTEVPELLELAADHLVLEPWSEATVGEYVARFGRTSEWALAAAAWVHRQSGGNALHVRELTVAAYAEASADADEGGDTARFVAPLDAPPNLLATLKASLVGLAAATRRDLGAAAVLGRRFRWVEWEQMGVDVAGSLAAAEEAGVLRRESAANTSAYDVEFRHDLLHRLVIDEMSSGQRSEWHDSACRAIESLVLDANEQAGRSDELAHHALGAVTIDPRRTIDTLLVSIDVDTRRFAYEAAIEKSLAGLEATGEGGPAADRAARVEFAVHVGMLSLRIGDPDALDLLFDAAEFALDLGDDVLVAKALRETCRLGPTSVVGTVHPKAASLLERAMADVSDPKAMSIVATAGVMLYAISGEYERCRGYFEHAVAYRGDDATRADALALAVLVLTKRDDIDRRAEIERELSGIAERLGTPDAMWGAAHLRMTNQVQTGDPDMRSTLEELGALAVTMRQQARRWEYTNWAAAVATTDGDPGRAEQLATEALGCLGAVAESLVMSAYGAQLLAIRHAQGRVHELIDTVRAIVNGDGPVIGAWHAVLALAAAGGGDRQLAQEQLELVCAEDFAILDRDYTFNGALFAGALAACEIGDADTAFMIEKQLLPWSGLWAFVGTCAMGPVDVALARSAALRGDMPLALERAGQALRSAEHAGAPIYVRQIVELIGTFDLTT